jgi:hypothetical protein
MADAETARLAEEERRKSQGGRGSLRFAPDLRSEVLRLASRRDRRLGEEFLGKLKEAKEREAQEATTKAANQLNSYDPRFAPEADAKRLRLAEQLLSDDFVERAIQFADPALNQVNRDTIGFLSTLREKDAVAADQRFAALLARAASDPASDANTVSGLSSYALTPFFYITFSQSGGASSSQRRETIPPIELPATLRAAFFSTAAQILLRPIPAPEQDHTSAGRIGKYLVIRRLLPLFEQHDPDRAAALNAQLAALVESVPERMRSSENSALTRGLVPEDPNRDGTQNLQERLDNAANSAERDSIYADVAVGLSRKDNLRARDLADKIEDSELRKQTRAFVDFSSMLEAVNKKKAEEALRVARTGEMSHVQRAWGYSQVARMFLKTDRTRALELLDDALKEARSIGGSEADRPRALVGIATVFVEADRERAWELMLEVIRAANSAEGFTGEDAQIVAMLQYKNGTVTTNPRAPDFDLPGVFRQLARADLPRAAELAKGFTAEAPRSSATLAVARAILDQSQNKPSENRRQSVEVIRQ